MKRREMLLATGAAALGMSMFPLGWARAATNKKQKILYFTRSVGFEHSPVHRQGRRAEPLREAPDRDGREARRRGRLHQGRRALRRRPGPVRLLRLLHLRRPDQALDRQGPADDAWTARRSCSTRSPAARASSASTRPPTRSIPRARPTRTRPSSIPTSPCSAASSSPTASSRRRRCRSPAPQVPRHGRASRTSR